MKPLLLTFFLVNLTYGFSQKGGDPFDLSTYSIKESNIKTISEYDSDSTKVKYAVYDQHGNQTYYKEEDRIIQFELDYNEQGNLKEEVAIGFRHELILKKQRIYNDLGKIESINYFLPIPPYYEGFIEKYNYHKDGRVDNIDVYSIPENRLMFQHSYVYRKNNEVQAIRTIGIEKEDTSTYFTKKFSYYRNGDMKKSSLLTTKGDTIAIYFFGEKGLLVKEIISGFYTSPSDYMYSPTLYSEALSKVKTPLTPFVILKKLYRENYQGKEQFYIKHEYENGKLLKSIKSVKHKEGKYILSTESYEYNAQNKLRERVTINHANHDTTTVRFSSDQTQRYIHLSENSRSYLVVKKEMNTENTSEELIIEFFSNTWECKTTTEFDSIANTVTKKRFCLDSENHYPSEPEQVTIASFDSLGYQINDDTFFEAKKAAKNTSYLSAENGELIRYEFNGQYWKYYYNPNDSTLIKQEYYEDSTYENLVAYYNYEYDSVGNYTVNLIYLNENDISPFNPIIQQFDSAGKVLKREWIAVEEYSARTISYTYNEGLCTESIFKEWGDEYITRYEYEFY